MARHTVHITENGDGPASPRWNTASLSGVHQNLGVASLVSSLDGNGVKEWVKRMREMMNV